jgi:serine/threonine protein phosphatase 1
MVKLAFVGDIHGDSERLRRAINTMGSQIELVVFLGDYVNRGPHSRGVLDLLVEYRRSLSSRLILLRGNHDQALLDLLRTGDARNFIALGGLSTIRSYIDPKNPPLKVLTEFIRVFPQPHRELLEATALYYETDALLASHCGYDPRRPDRRGLQEMVCGSYPEIFRSQQGSPRPTVVVGHYVQASGEPHDSPGLIGLDTGCGTGEDRPLTILYWPERRFVRID